MVSTGHVISKSSIPCTNPLVPVASAPNIIGITVTFMFRSLFSSLVRSRYLSRFSFFSKFYPIFNRNGDVHYSTGSFFSFFFFFLLTHSVCLRHLWDVRPYAWSLILLLSHRFVEVLPLSTLRMAPSSLVSSRFLVLLRYSFF